MTPEQFDLTENKPAKHIIAMERVRHAGLVLGEAEAKSEIALAFRNQALEVYNIPNDEDISCCVAMFGCG